MDRYIVIHLHNGMKGSNELLEYATTWKTLINIVSLSKKRPIIMCKVLKYVKLIYNDRRQRSGHLRRDNDQEGS